MLLHKILFLLLLSVILTIKCHILNHDILNISIGIGNARTVIACGLSIDIYSSFNSTQIITCPHVFIHKQNIQLIDINITIDDQEKVNIHLFPETISLPKLSIEHINNSFVISSNFTGINIYYLLFSSELTCRYSFIKNIIICFYYPLSMDFIQIEHHFDRITNINLILSDAIRNRFIIIFIILTILITIGSIFILYILCTNQLRFYHTIQLDYIIDPQLAKETALKLSPEPI